MANILVQRGYQIENYIGHGSYGTVYAVTKKESDVTKRYVVKIMQSAESAHRGDGDSTADQAQCEVQIHKSVRHQHIIDYVDSFTEEDTVYLVLDIANHGNLKEHLDRQPSKRLSEDERKSLFRQLVSAVNYLHINNIYHGDLKPHNILLDDDNSLRLCDFGSARIVTERSKRVSVDSDKGCTVAYAAPECFIEQEYDPGKADVFSMGVVLYEMIEGNNPFKDSSIFKGNHSPPVFATPVEQDLLTKMLKPSSTDRLDMSAVLDHPYVAPANGSQFGQGDC
jgi:serine/threonine protein kinase